MIKSFCPVCESEFEISELELKIAKRLAENDKVLIACTNCCRVLIVDVNGETFVEKIQEIVENDDWLPCVPFLDQEVLKMPAGFVDHHGLKLYRAVSGDVLLSKREYMKKYGIDPECMLKKMRGV